LREEDGLMTSWLRERALLIVTLAVVAAAALLPSSTARAGSAGRPGVWTQISNGPQANIDQIGLARTRDGVLHVVFRRKNGSNEDLVHTAVSPAGSVVGSPTPIVTDWAGVTNASLVVGADGNLRALFSGLRSADVNDPYASGTVYSATAPAAGTSWALAGTAAPQSTAYASDLVGAAVAGDGRIVTDWASTFGTVVHLGLDPSVPSQTLQGPCCGYQTTAATDGASGEVYAAWYSNASSGQGTFAQGVAPSLGSKLQAPGSVTNFNGAPSSIGADQLTAISGRIGAGGVYVAYGSGYPTAQTVDLWQIGSSAPTIAVKAPGARHVALGQGPEGRLWLIWDRNGRLYAARTNRAATRIGPVIAVKPPAQTGTIFKTRGDGAPGPLDLFTLVQLTNGAHSTWHTQVLPGLTLSAKPASFKAKKGAKVVVSVADAGDPVAGAKVTLAGKHATTNAKGRATVAIGRGRARKLTASAVAPGYRKASATVRAR
jgi:hypothetical protein